MAGPAAESLRAIGRGNSAPASGVMEPGARTPIIAGCMVNSDFLRHVLPILVAALPRSRNGRIERALSPNNEPIQTHDMINKKDRIPLEGLL